MTNPARGLVALVFLSCIVAGASRRPCTRTKNKSKRRLQNSIPYEVWASDQSNSAPDQTSLGVKGSFLWVYKSEDIQIQLQGGEDAKAVSCTSDKIEGPCDMLEVFPQDLEEFDATGAPTGNALGDLDGFGRLHGVIADKFGKYVTANFFVPGGGYIGVIDTETKEAICLFRVTKLNFGEDSSTRSVHMSFWSVNGDYLMIANLAGKAIERLNIERDDDGTITSIKFDKGATLGLSSNMSVAEEATVFLGKNALGNDMMGEVVGDYDDADLGDLTPSGSCKENGCTSGPMGEMGGRANNVPICPIASMAEVTYITLGGGGLLVADHTTTPMTIVGEYGRTIVYGAGCGGVESNGRMYLNSGVSASPAGFDQSMFALFSFDDKVFPRGSAIMSGMMGYTQNEPMPERIFQDPGNTLTGGNVEGTVASDMSGQVPGITTRRDSHGAVATDRFVYIVDRIQNTMEVFGVNNYKHNSFDLVSKTGEDGRSGVTGECYRRSVRDDIRLPLNDPAPDLMSKSPDDKYIMVALRGPTPVSVPHTAQGSCPGVGIVKLRKGGKTGRLVGILRTTNTVPDSVNITESTFLGGIPYSGMERSDIHGAEVVVRSEQEGPL